MPDPKLYEPKFKRGDIVYFSPKSAMGKSKLLSVKPDTPYKVMLCQPKSEAYINLCIELPNGRTPFFDADEFISEEEWKNKNKQNKEKKFNVGDKIYYVGGKGLLSYNVPYTVRGSSSYLDIIQLEGEDKVYNNDAFISEKEWLEKNKKNITHDFQPGEEVYYNGPDKQLDHHFRYRLWEDHKNPDVFEISVNGEFKKISKQFVNMFFISSAEYIQKYGKEMHYKNAQKKSPNVGNFIDFLKSTETEEDFLKSVENDTEEEDKGERKPKDDIKIRMQIFKDTKAGKLKWAMVKGNYETMISLKNPRAFLKIYVKKIHDEEWEMKIFYDRTGFKEPALVKHYTSSAAIKSLSKLINQQIEKALDDIINKMQNYPG